MSTAESLALAKSKLAQGRLTAADLDALAGSPTGAERQWLLYIHAAHPSIYSEVLSATLHEPVPGKAPQVDPLATPPPYTSVHHAICEGWRVVHFPNQRDAFHDREIDIVGYEFILERIARPA